jgi:uncharacterized protein
MPATLSYPGVYVEEIPSGVRTITGVATSITAFVGRAARGPCDTAYVIHSFGDFETVFGGLWSQSTMGYAVADFFANGGSTAIIVRLFQDPTANGGAAPATIAELDVAPLKIHAISPGSWGTYLTAKVTAGKGSADVAQSIGADVAALFDLVISDTSPGGATESFTNLVLGGDSYRRVDTYVGANSRLVTIDKPADGDAFGAGTEFTDAFTTTMAGLQTALTDAKNALYAETPTDDHAALVQAVTDAQTAINAAITAQLATASDGAALTANTFTAAPAQTDKTGLYSLEQADLFNILCIPPYTASGDVDPALLDAAATYCETRRAMLVVDAPTTWTTSNTAVTGFNSQSPPIPRSRNAALFFPRLQEADPLRNGQIGTFAACGAVAGVFARTDTDRGVWKAPAGLDATLNGTLGLSVALTDLENGDLNPLGVNCLRARPDAGRVVWGSRTLRGADVLADEYKYIPVRRTALYIEESLFRGTQWVVFEPNAAPLWAQIRLNVGAFMHNMFRLGAFEGQTPQTAYFVECDDQTTTQNDIDLGVVNILVGFAPLKPAEFVVIKLQQMAGQIQT